MDNNASERSLRRLAVGRKNWLFIGSPDGGAANARFSSLLASCHMHGIEPWRYLRDLFCLLPLWPISQVIDLAPAYWEKTILRPEVNELLLSNPLRQITLRQAPPAFRALLALAKGPDPLPNSHTGESKRAPPPLAHPSGFAERIPPSRNAGR
jgi:hypothetical protein